MVGRINGSETNLWQTKSKLLEKSWQKGRKQTSGNLNTTNKQTYKQTNKKQIVGERNGKKGGNKRVEILTPPHSQFKIVAKLEPTL